MQDQLEMFAPPNRHTSKTEPLPQIERIEIHGDLLYSGQRIEEPQNGMQVKAQAYDEAKADGTITKSRQEVLDAIKTYLQDEGVNTFTRNEIQAHSGKPINIISGRVNDLMKEGIVVSAEPRTKKDTFTGKTVQLLQLAQNSK